MLSELIKKARLNTYRSARQFYQSQTFSFSYTHYKNVEDGVVPSASCAIEIIKALGIGLRQGLYAWAHDTMPDADSKLVFSVIESGERFKFQDVPSGDSFEIGRHQADYFRRCPTAWEVLVYLLCEYSHRPGRAKTTQEIAEYFNFDGSAIDEILHELYRYGLLNTDETGKRFSTREWVYFKREPEIENVRATLLHEAFVKFEKAKDNGLPVHHMTLTQKLSDELASELNSRLGTVINWLSEQANGPIDNGKHYTLGLFLSPRLYGNRELM